MERFSKVLIFILVAGFVITSCEKSDEPALQDSDLVALQGMEDAYTGAAIHQDALKEAIDDADSALIHMHDSLFHHFAILFESHHADYSHSNNHDDHRHNTNGMHMMGGGGNMHGMWTDGHHEADHDLMDGLMDDHNPFHQSINDSMNE